MAFLFSKTSFFIKAYEQEKSKGFTLVEIMVGLLIITIAFLSLGTIFTSISKSFLVNKTKTLATNLAQEKIESLKNLTYYRLLVTTGSTSDSNFSGMIYDVGYYPEENLNVGGTQFWRRTYIEFVKQDGNELMAQPWTANDTGIKKITVYVVWKENEDWKSVEFRNLRNNPNRAELEYTFTGKITSGTTGNAIYNALVETQQNPSYFSRTDASGNYSFKVQPGTYTLRASATGYFTAISSNYVVSSGQTGSSSQNFGLSLKAVGEATGYAYIFDHLVISQVVSSTDVAGSGEQEWVELFNPTTYNILIASRVSAASDFNVFFVTVTWIDNNDAEPSSGNNAKYFVGMPGIIGSVFTAFRSSSSHWTANSSTISIPSNHYFLIANQSTITFATSSGNAQRIADAYYSGNRIDNTGAGGIRITGSMGKSYNGRSDWLDGVAWRSTSGDNSPTLAREGAGYDLSSFVGLTAGGILFRAAFKSNDSYDATVLTADRRNTSPFAGNSFDRNSNGTSYDSGSDWIRTAATSFYNTSSGVVNADFSAVPYSGAPAAGASVTSNDGLSAMSFAQSYGSFTVVNMATGSWTITISSGNYTRDVSFVNITPSISTGIPNASTDPAWQFSALSPSWGNIALTTITIYGYVSGTVKDILNQGLGGVTVSASGADSVTTDSQGVYRLSVIPSGSAISVIANKSGYSTEIVTDISVSLGVNVSAVNFALVSAGSVKGFVTTNGSPSGALPGIPVVAYDLSSTTVYGSAITGTDGTFTIPSIQTGTYNIVPQLETGESSSPSLSQVTVTNASTGTWSSTFTVSNAFGNINGAVTNSGSPITVGVLVVASTSSITSQNPPDIDASVRSGGAVYYSVSSDSLGNYSLSLRGGASYYLYGWYATSLGVDVSSAPKRQVTSPSAQHSVGAGETITRNITW